MLQMSKIFFGLAFWNTVLFAVTIWMAIIKHPLHGLGLGVLTGVYTCLTHSIVMMHFMGSGKGIKEAVDGHQLPNDPQDGYVRRTRKFKARSSPCATFSCIFIIAAVWLGGWTHTSPGNYSAFLWHRWFTWFAVVYNLYSFRVEYKVICENTAMIQDINNKITSTTTRSKNSSMKKELPEFPVHS